MVQNKNQGQQDSRQQTLGDSKLKDKNRDAQQEEQRNTSRKGDKSTQGRKDNPGRKH